YDTETTGFPKRNDAPLTDFDNWPRMVQIAWQLHGEMGEFIEAKNFIIKPEGFDIPYGAEKIHGISTKKALEEGHPLDEVLNQFNEAIKQAAFIVGHNVQFYINIAGC